MVNTNEQKIITMMFNHLTEHHFSIYLEDKHNPISLEQLLALQPQDNQINLFVLSSDNKEGMINLKLNNGNKGFYLLDNCSVWLDEILYQVFRYISYLQHFEAA